MNPINEPYNGEIRRRLRLARIAKQMTQQDISVVAPSTMTNYEVNDISPAKLGDLIAIAIAIGMNPRDFFDYLLGSDDLVVARSDTTKNLDEMSIYLRDLPPELQETCVAVVRTITAQYRNTTPAEVARVASRKPHA